MEADKIDSEDQVHLTQPTLVFVRHFGVLQVPLNWLCIFVRHLVSLEATRL